ncbi:restriction endonuclease subunit S [Tepidanaerobacter syntrophicus]|uniref:restriction endonuclease subunit S n=1 Tax=Tepidanaerobacter syntrophicus TaxID=224999 RepID=UPI001BD52BA7|nr:restriction endonuclease subunit S [Tepidanaerobacter syntrophicus]
MIQLSFPTKKLKEYIKRVNVKLKDTNYNQDDLTVYGVTNTEGITITGNQTSEDLGNYIVLKENQLAYNPYRVNVGSIGLAPKGLLGLVSPAYTVFETTEELSAEFLYYYLKSSLGVNLIKWYGDRGGVRSALRYNDLCEIDIPDLNLNQQMSVLKKMKEVNTEIDEFNNEVHCQEQLISKLRKNILQEAVQGKLVPQDPNAEPASVLLERIKEEKERLIKEGKIKKGKPLPPIAEDEIPYELPKGWEWVYINDIAFVTKLAGFEYTKYLSTAISESGDVPIIRAQNIKMNKFIENANEFISYDLSEKLSRSAVYKKCLLMTFIGAGIGEVVIFNKNNRFHLAPNVAKIEIFNNFSFNIDEKYILYYLMSESGQNEIFRFQKATAQPSLSMDTIRKVRIPIPPLSEQKRIVQKVDQLMALCNELEKNIEQSKKDSELLMQSVLQEAFKEA